MSETYASHPSDEWGTPPDLFDLLNREYHFTLDAAASAANTLVPSAYITAEENALMVDWVARGQGGAVFLNPPYTSNKVVTAFIAKAAETGEQVPVVCLLKAKTDPKWFHEIVLRRAEEVRFVKGRLTYVFAGVDQPARFPSMVVVFAPRTCGPRPVFKTQHRNLTEYFKMYGETWS